MSEQEIEQKIQDKGLNAPRVTPSHIDSIISSAEYHVFPGTTLTVCCITLRNGFTVTGESAAASPENFDAEIGKEVAFKNAREKIWSLEGYLLKERLFMKEMHVIHLSPAEIQSGLDRVKWAENLIKQLPVDHDGRNSWLLNYGRK